MSYDPQKHHRRSIRLPDYDYTCPGGYFVTLVTWQREPLFGHIQGEAIQLSPAGIITREEWFKTAGLRQNVRLEEAEFVVMPNHVHGIVWIVGDELDECNEEVRVGAQRRCAPTPRAPLHPNAPPIPTPPTTNVPPNSLGAIVRAYKSAVTYRINALKQTRGAPVWQRNYYEHIIRNNADWRRITDYIRNNPLLWDQDQLHPNAPNHPFNQDHPHG